ncbi:MAG UNVERIFIED_CONTAM: hypothetical protein LVR18_30830 [Planctomycetaceae bacterium]
MAQRALLESGHAAIIPGNSSASPLIQRLLATDPDVVMPPPSTGKAATPQQIEVLKSWIDQGAEYRGHWSFIRPELPTVPSVPADVTARNPSITFSLPPCSKPDSDRLRKPIERL